MSEFGVHRTKRKKYKAQWIAQMRATQKTSRNNKPSALDSSSDDCDVR